MNNTLTKSIQSLSLPEHIVRSVIADYFDFLKERKPEVLKVFEEKINNDKEWHDRIYFEVQGSMLASTLILTMDKDVDLDPLLKEVYGLQQDPDLLDMRKELVSRAIMQNKDTLGLTGLNIKLIKKRQAVFCSEPEEREE